MTNMNPPMPASRSRSTFSAARRAAGSSAPASNTITSAPGRRSRSESTATADGAAARAARAAIARRRVRQPSCAGACGCACATSIEPPRSSSRSPTSRACGDELVARGQLARPSSDATNAAAASSEARSGARTRSTSDAISVLTSRTSPGDGVPRARSRSCADLGVADAQRDRLDAGSVAEQRLLVGRRARRDRERLAAAIDARRRWRRALARRRARRPAARPRFGRPP